MAKKEKEELITNPRFYSDGEDFVFLKKVVDGKVVFDNTKKKKASKPAKKASKK